MFTEKILVCELQDNPLLAPLIGAEGTRLLREERWPWETPQECNDEEAPGPPAESEYLQRKSTTTVRANQWLQLKQS
ncbi:hypothetical protein BTR22_13440 [Alkalihalophilus pseudofirmus]|nr:hypothetical protein BTR22_13440 [Alkalihalophilus pseudofirmus]